MYKVLQKKNNHGNECALVSIALCAFDKRGESVLIESVREGPTEREPKQWKKTTFDQTRINKIAIIIIMMITCFACVQNKAMYIVQVHIVYVFTCTFDEACSVQLALNSF